MASAERLSKDEWAKRAAAKVSQAQERLATEVAALQSGDDWKNYLAFQARLHAYSPNNVMLIAAQHAAAFEEGRVPEPLPTYVAGFNTWRSLGRSVGKGQHGYAVLAPCRYDRPLAVDADGNTRPLARDETPATGESVDTRKVLAGFRIEYVFDVSQTSGAEVPAPVRPKLLQGEAPTGLGAAVVSMVGELGFRLDTVQTLLPSAAPSAGPTDISSLCS